MKALTLICPWAAAVAYWGKTIENRTWPPPESLVGERLAIHAGKSPFRQRKDGWTWSDAARDEVDDALGFIQAARGAMTDEPVTPRWLHERSSAILCVATVAGWVHEHGRSGLLAAGGAPVTVRASPWFVGPYGWVLTDVVTLATPVPCKGSQGLWVVPPDVEERVLAQAEPPRAAGMGHTRTGGGR